MGGRFYQEIVVEKTLDAIADKKPRVLLTLATGTGKTFIAFQIAWKLFQTRWNLQYDGKTIHSNYNGWIQNLDKAINRELLAL